MTQESNNGRVNTGKGPLEGIRVIDCTQWIQGGTVGVILSDLGADVIKVENTTNGDELRGWLQSGFGAQTHKIERNYVFEQCNRGKRSITLNLKNQEGRKIFYKLVQSADVFMHNWRNDSVAKRLEIDYERLHRLNPHLIYSHVSGWGPKGPLSDQPAYDIAAQARTGMIHLFREPEGNPVVLPGGVGDIIGAAYGVIGILSCLVSRGSKEGTGQMVNTALMGSLIQVMALQVAATGIAREDYPLRARGRMGNPLWNYYKCKDNKWITFAMLQPDKYWHNFCVAIGNPELEKDPRFSDLTVRAKNALEVIAILDRWFITKTQKEWLDQFKATGLDLIYGPMQTIPEVINDPQALANDYVVEITHPTFGPVKAVGIPHQFSDTPADPRKSAPEYGQHTEEILLELGYTWDDIVNFKEKRAI